VLNPNQISYQNLVFRNRLKFKNGALFPVISETPLFPSNVDFNQISSAWAKRGYWQDNHWFEQSNASTTTLCFPLRFFSALDKSKKQ